MKKIPTHFSLLEIGTEEIPARFMPPALNQLSSLMEDGLKNANVPFSKIEVFGSPRRLTALIHSVAARSNDKEDIAIGPPPKAAKNDKGEWTPAALGFAKAQGVDVEQLLVRETPKGERLVSIKNVKGQKVEAVLKDLFPSVIKKLYFPKTMIWDESGFRFPRPIRWIVALYNSNVIRFKVGDVGSDRKTLGLLALGGQKILVSKPEKYKSLLQGRCILVDQDVRRKNIQNQLESAAKKVKANVISTPEHLEEVVFLNEYPSTIVGHFPEDYLTLPKEILVLVMKKHQKFFPLESSKGQLTNMFIGVRNGPSESQEEVREGYERVVNARLSDAKFFVEKDSQLNMYELASKLTGVGFHEKLGTMWDKTKRVENLVAKLGEVLELDTTLVHDAKRAAHMCKADLLTQIVGELPELQGVAGRFYTEKTEKPEISRAMEEHYWPISSDGHLPTSPVSALVALADKLDTLAADFSVGLVPSGSADPYGLRRLAVGIVRIVMDQKWKISLKRLTDMASEGLSKSAELNEFLKQRCLNWFANQGYRVDEIEAVLSSSEESLSVFQEKLESLKSVRGRPEFETLAGAIKRARNILTQAKEKGILPHEKELRPDELQEPSEKLLYEQLTDVRNHFIPLMSKNDFQQALLQLGALKGPIDGFFKDVMVMVDDEMVRSRRLRLLMLVRELFDNFADFSKLQGASTSAPVPVAASNE